MDWKAHIGTDGGKLAGKPVVRGTRLSVDFLLGLRGAGWTEEQIIENYPTLTPDDPPDLVSSPTLRLADPEPLNQHETRTRCRCDPR